MNFKTSTGMPTFSYAATVRLVVALAGLVSSSLIPGMRFPKSRQGSSHGLIDGAGTLTAAENENCRRRGWLSLRKLEEFRPHWHAG